MRLAVVAVTVILSGFSAFADFGTARETMRAQEEQRVSDRIGRDPKEARQREMRKWESDRREKEQAEKAAHETSERGIRDMEKQSRLQGPVIPKIYTLESIEGRFEGVSPEEIRKGLQQHTATWQNCRERFAHSDTGEQISVGFTVLPSGSVQNERVDLSHTYPTKDRDRTFRCVLEKIRNLQFRPTKNRTVVDLVFLPTEPSSKLSR